MHGERTGTRDEGGQEIVEARIAMELLQAFGPQTHYWIANTPAEVLRDWREFKLRDPPGDLRTFVRMLVAHERSNWNTPTGPLLRRLVVFLRSHETRPRRADPSIPGTPPRELDG